jgi:two-component system NarL family sensor kinase
MQQEGQEFLVVGLLGTILFLLQSGFIIFYLLFFKRKQKKNQQDRIAMQVQYENEILSSQMEVREQTLEYIGQELHDNIGQLLTVIRLNLSIVEESELSFQNSKAILDSNEAVDKAISDLRTLSKSLDGNFVNDFGLEESLTNELFRLRKTGKYITELHIKGVTRHFGFQSEILLFRVCQEILNNVLKHAFATRIDVFLIYEPNNFRLRILDNGRGYNTETVQNRIESQKGSGLGNIQRRIALMGGTCIVTSSEKQGTIVEIALNDQKDGLIHS